MLNEAEMIIVIHLLAARTSMYLDEIQEELYNMTGTYVHNSTICRTMQYLGFCRKRLQRIALQCSDDLRGKFMAEISLFDPAMIVWLMNLDSIVEIPSEHTAIVYEVCALLIIN